MRENEFFRHGGLARIFTLSSDPPLDPHSARASRLASVCESIVWATFRWKLLKVNGAWRVLTPIGQSSTAFRFVTHARTHTRTHENAYKNTWIFQIRSQRLKKHSWTPRVPDNREDTTMANLDDSFCSEAGEDDQLSDLCDDFADVFIDDFQDTEELLKAAAQGNRAKIESLLSMGLAADARNQSITALIEAAKNGHSECVEVLLKAGADVNHPYGCDWTALIEAARKGHTECVDLLLKSGANVNWADQAGSTALIEASRGGHTGCVDLLVESGATGSSSLTEAKTGGHRSPPSTEKPVDQPVPRRHPTGPTIWAQGLSARCAVRETKALLPLHPPLVLLQCTVRNPLPPPAKKSAGLLLFFGCQSAEKWVNSVLFANVCAGIVSGNAEWMSPHVILVNIVL